VVLLTQQSGEVWLRSGIIIAVGLVLYAATKLARRARN
jgi:APA family basic amino acid/polyamine antiporter